jgi:Sporulation and spore germination
MRICITEVTLVEEDAMSRLFLFFSFAATVVALLGCNSTAIPTPMATRVVSPTAIPTSVPTETSAPTSTATSTRAPSPTPTVAAIPTRTPTIPAKTTRVKLYFVAIDDNGKSGKKIGCNDSLVAVDREISATSAPLTVALNELFSLKGQFYGQSGLYNALYQSKIKVASVTIVDGKATINLSGSLVLNGICDNPRVEAQVEQVALQFSTVSSVVVYLNGIPLQQALSEK